MSFNGSGTFVINSAGQPVVANTVISATVFNALTADLATGLTNCITKDGQSTPTANIPMGNNKITGLGAGTAATDAATLGQVQSTAAKLISVTGTDTISGTMSPALTAYAAGQLFYFIANAANTGAMTINIDGLGAKNITRDGSTALVAGDVNSGEIVVICYDGTRFQMINAANSFGNTTINGTLTVTGKSDLPTVSTASINAAVAVVTTGTVTNLTATSASVASMNAGVALLTTATVTTLTATGASIASANIGNLQFTAASIASINAGVAVVTNLTATSASIASMNGSVASITTVNATTVNATNVEVTNVKANDGTTAITIADSTGAVTVGAGATINGGAVFNETGADVDFRIESDTNANAFFLDGATGNVGIGGAAGAGELLQISGTLPSSGTVSRGLQCLGVMPSSTTAFGIGYSTFLLTEAASFTLSNLPHFYADQGTIGAGSTVTNQYGFYVNASLTGATNNYGFYSNIASGSGRYNFFANGSADNYFAGNTGIGTSSPTRRLDVIHDTLYQFRVGTSAANSYDIGRSGSDGYLHFYGNQSTVNGYVFEGIDGTRMTIDASGNVGIGGTANAFAKVEIAGTLPTSSNISIANYTQVTVPSGSTTNFQGYRTSISTTAASFTVSNGYHFYAAQGTIGAGSAITNQYGYFADGSLTGATNNYGFYSNIASGSNRWNFYAAGTAQNYMAGNLLLGVSSPGYTSRFVSRGATSDSTAWHIYGETSAGTYTLAVRNDGKFYTGIAASSPYNDTTANAANVVVDSAGLLQRSTSSLRYKSDVTNAAHGLADVLKLRSVTYKGKNDGDKVFGGLIAEEVHDAGLTEFVAYDKEGRPDALHYGNMVALLVKAIQELTARVAELEAK